MFLKQLEKLDDDKNADDLIDSSSWAFDMDFGRSALISFKGSYRYCPGT